MVDLPVDAARSRCVTREEYGCAIRSANLESGSKRDPFPRRGRRYGQWVIPWAKVLLISVGGYVFSLATTYLPSRQAAAIPPAEALRSQ